MRVTLAISLSLCALASLGCEPTTMTPGEDAGVRLDARRVRDTGPDAPRLSDAGVVTRVPEATAEAGRTGCTFGRGAMPWETVGEEFPIGDDIPIRHFILVMQENRSFDHYFGTMPGVDGYPAGYTNLDETGATVAPFHETRYCVDDPHHGWSASHDQWNDGANDGFGTANGSDGGRALGYLTDADIPFYWDLYSTFAMSERHFCSVLGPTWPNRMYFFSGSSFGLVNNDAPPPERYEVGPEGDHILAQQLDRAGVSWAVYSTSVPFEWGAFPRWGLLPESMEHQRRLAELYSDLEDGTLPEVSWVNPAWTTGGTQATDEHPPANPQIGEVWLRDIILRLLRSPHWADTALILTYDEHGGFADHVPPPEACAPGDFPAPTGDGYDFDRLGFRVPLVIVSPYARAGYVSDRVTDHASILRLIQARYLLPAMTGRDANAWPLLDMFDFADPPFATPPAASEMAEASVEPGRNAACMAEF